jgi:hypothetical protein
LAVFNSATLYKKINKLSKVLNIWSALMK